MTGAVLSLCILRSVISLPDRLADLPALSCYVLLLVQTVRGNNSEEKIQEIGQEEDDFVTRSALIRPNVLHNSPAEILK